MTTLDEAPAVPAPAPEDGVASELEAALASIIDAAWEAPADAATLEELAGADMELVNEWGARRARVERRRMAIKAEHARRVAPLLDIIRRAHEEIALHDDWSAAMDAPLARSAAWLDASLTARALLVRDKTACLGPKQVKSLRTPHVTVTTREAGGGLVVTNEEQALAWATAYHPELVKTELRRGDAARVLELTDAGVVDKTTGDLVEGVAFEAKTVTAKVKLAGGSVDDAK